MTSLKFLFGPGSRSLAVTKRHVSVRHWGDTSIRRPLHDSQLDAVIGAKTFRPNRAAIALLCYKTLPSGGCQAQRQQQNYEMGGIHGMLGTTRTARVGHMQGGEQRVLEEHSHTFLNTP